MPRIFFGLLLVSLAVLLISCAEGDGSASTAEIPDTVSEGFRQVTVSAEGRVEVMADRVETYGESDRTVFHGTRMTEIDPEGELTLEGGADYIEMTGKGDGYAAGSVRLLDVDEETRLEAERLDWNDGDRLLTGTGEVTIHAGEDLVVTGEGFVADVARESYTFTEGVEGTLYIDD